MSVPEYWWVGYKAWTRHSGKIAKIDYNAREQCYFVLVLDKSPCHEYGMAYESVVLYADTAQFKQTAQYQHGKYYLPALPPSDPGNETSVSVKKRKQHRHDGSPARPAASQGKTKKQRILQSQKRKGDGWSDARASPACGEVMEATQQSKNSRISKTNSKVSVVPPSMLLLPSYYELMFMICTVLTGLQEGGDKQVKGE